MLCLRRCRDTNRSGASKPTALRILVATTFTMLESSTLASGVLRHGVTA